MNDELRMNGDSSDVDSLLAVRGEPSDSLRGALRKATSAKLARRAWGRKALRIARLAACYLAGAATLFAWQSLSATSAAPREVTAEKNMPPPDAHSREETVAGVKPAQLPAAAGRLPKTRYASLRELGDRHLIEGRNPAGAIRCYRLALQYATTSELTAASHDGTWLLRAICHDRTSERTIDKTLEKNDEREKS